ncbi:HIT domain-containing protein (plasmid) [Saccharothrix sp. AJ9571]|nr:HIT domain-containing protein [Saccharothrix sp. AJ9571]
MGSVPAAPEHQAQPRDQGLGERASTEPARVRRAWDRGEFNIGLATGPGPSGLVVADLDLRPHREELSMRACAFCSIVAGDAPATVVRRWKSVIAIRPRRGGVNDGHVLVIPHQHVTDVGTDPAVAATAMAAAAELASELPACNVITSKGRTASQTVFHLHIHIVPRREGDNLPLPWTPQQEAEQTTKETHV